MVRKEGFSSDKEREDFYQTLINEAPYIPGDEDKTTHPKQIEWLDPELVKDGQRFYRRNSFVIVMAHLAALLFGFSFRRLSTVLLRTGKSTEVEDSMTRYLSTFRHFNMWYQMDIASQYSNLDEKGFQDVQRVRAMHLHALKKSETNRLPTLEELEPTEEKLQLMEALKLDLAEIEAEELPKELRTYEPLVPMSQFDMVMTQFGLVSLIYMFPETLGIKKDPKGVRGFLHLWAIFGRLLGIEDRFNIALFPDRELYQRIYMNVGIGCLKETDLAVVTLQKSFIDGTYNLTGYGTLKGYLYLGLKSPEALPAFKGENLYRLMDWKDLFYYLFLRILFFIYPKVTCVRVSINYMSNKMIGSKFSNFLFNGSGKKRSGKVKKKIPRIAGQLTQSLKPLSPTKPVNDLMWM